MAEDKSPLHRSWIETIQSIELRLPFPVRLTVYSRYDQVEIMCTATVPDVHTGHTIEIHSYTIQTNQTAEFEKHRILYRMIREVFLHELDEGFFVRGKQFINPHL